MCLQHECKHVDASATSSTEHSINGSRIEGKRKKGNGKKGNGRKGNRNEVGKKGNGKLGNLPVVASCLVAYLWWVYVVGLNCYVSLCLYGICTPLLELQIWNIRKR